MRDPGDDFVEFGGGESEVGAVVFGGHEAAARAQHIAQVIRQAFIDPQQFASHRLGVVGGGQARGTAVLPIPRVGVLMRQYRAAHLEHVVGLQRVLGQRVIRRLMMLKATVGREFRQR